MMNFKRVYIRPDPMKVLSWGSESTECGKGSFKRTVSENLTGEGKEERKGFEELK